MPFGAPIDTDKPRDGFFCFLLMPTSHAPLDRLAFSLSRCPKIRSRRKLRPLGISTVRDRVCMTAAMLVLEPIFEADLPPEIYAYRAGRNAQQAAVEVEELLFRGHPDVVDADLAHYLEAASYCPPAYEVTSNSVG